MRYVCLSGQIRRSGVYSSQTLAARSPLWQKATHLRELGPVVGPWSGSGDGGVRARNRQGQVQRQAGARVAAGLLSVIGSV